MEGDTLEPNERQYWLWVTRPDYYLEDDGSDREILDPTYCTDSGGWWTCHKDTKKGDLVFLWRTSPKKDIGYLIQAESDAYSIVDDNDHGWDYGCDFEVLFKFDHPVHIKDLRDSPYFEEWSPLSGSFQKSNFKISSEYWNKLNQLAADKNPGYKDFIEQIQKEPIAEGIRLEIELEDTLAKNLKVLKKFGHDLELYVDPASKLSGRQLICKGNGGRIDLLCCDRTQKRYVVIELKNVRAGQNTFGQISNYTGWVQNRIAKNLPVIGVVISRGYDTRFESALKITDRISYINVDDLGFAIAPSKKIQEFIQRQKDTSPAGIRIANSREAKSWLKKGNAFFDQGKYEDAIPCYDNVIEKDPNNKWGWINKGWALAELKKHGEAISCLDHTTEMYPKSADVWSRKGFALNSLNKFDDAIVAFDKAIELKPKFADAWNGKGIVLCNTEKYDEAIQAYDKATIIRPKFALAWSNKGLALANRGKYDEAIKAYDEAIRLDPNNVMARINKGGALGQQGKHDEAVGVIDEAIEIDPQTATLWSLKGLVLNDQDKYDKAIQAYNKAIELDPEDADIWNNKGNALYDQEKYDEAIQAYDKAIELDPKLADAWMNKSEVFKSLGKNTEADTAFAKAKELGYKG